MLRIWRGPLGPSRHLLRAPRVCRGEGPLAARGLCALHAERSLPGVGSIPARGVAAATAAAAAAPQEFEREGSAKNHTQTHSRQPVVDASSCLAPLLRYAAAAKEEPEAAQLAGVREAREAFTAALEGTRHSGQPPLYRYDITNPDYRLVLRPATPPTPTAVHAAAAAEIPQQLLLLEAWDKLGSPFYVLLLQALHAAAEAVANRTNSNKNSSNSSSSAIEAAAAEIAAVWQLQVNKDLRRLRLAGEVVQGSDGCFAAAPAAADSASGDGCMLHHQDIEAAAAALLCTAAETASLLTEMQLKHSVRDLVPTLLLIFERLRLSRGLPSQQQQHQEQTGELQRSTAVCVSSAYSSAAAAAAVAGVRCLHALGRCQLFSEQLLETVAVEHVRYLDSDSLALYLFECGRMGLRCKRWIDACVERAIAAANEMSPPSLLLACSGLYRFCTEWTAFYSKATPCLITMLDQMDYYQLRLMLRIGKHLNPAFQDEEMNHLVRKAASLLNSRVASLAPQQLCCIASFVERRCTDTPAEFLDLTRSLVAELEAMQPTPTQAENLAPSATAAATPAGSADLVASDSLALVHPLHDLVDVVDCLASHGLQSSLVPRIEAIIASRFTEIEYSVNFTLWLVCLDAFSRVRNFYPRLLLQRITASICSADSNSSNSSNGLEAPNLLDSLSVVQRLKFMQSLTRLSFFPPALIRLWCNSVENEASLFRSLRDAVTCVFPLSLLVYVHPVVFGNALRFVDSRCDRSRRGQGLYASDRHLEFLYLSHLCWAFVVAEMHVYPSLVNLLSRTMAVAPPPVQSPDGSKGVEQSAAGSGCSEVFTFVMPWRQRDVLVPKELQEKIGAPLGGSRSGRSASHLALTPLDCISYRNYCEPTALLQQVCRILLLEAPHLAASKSVKRKTVEVYANSLVRWKTERENGLQHFLRDIRDVATAAGLKFTEANKGAPQASPAPDFGHLWPLSEVALWIERVPVVLMAEGDGLVLNMSTSGRQRNYNTGHKYLLLRAFKAMGFPKVVSVDPQGWKTAETQEQKEALLLHKLGL